MTAAMAAAAEALSGEEAEEPGEGEGAVRGLPPDAASATSDMTRWGERVRGAGGGKVRGGGG